MSRNAKRKLDNHIQIYFSLDENTQKGVLSVSVRLRKHHTSIYAQFFLGHTSPHSSNNQY